MREKASAAAAAADCCPACGLTEAELRQEGRMGCATCYTTFAPLVGGAVAELHGTVPQGANQAEIAGDGSRDPLPWPTRRASARPTPTTAAAAPALPAAPRRR